MDQDVSIPFAGLASEEVVGDGEGTPDGQMSSLETPRPLMRTGTGETLGHFPGYTLQPGEMDESGSVGQEETDSDRTQEDGSDTMLEPIHRVVTDETAQHSRDVELMGAAGGRASDFSPGPRGVGGEALTEENVGRLS
jgi:hypothetical protein